jgi:diguanylate cyclase (GGDEF)-like protein/PAS domain S-box-containing protein
MAVEAGISDRSAPAEPRLRALAGIAAAIDINWGDERLLRAIVDGVLITLGDPGTVKLTDVDGSPGPAGSNHPKAVRAELESTIVTDGVEAVVSSADPSGAWLAGHGLRQYAAFPVVSNARSVGVLAITRSADRPEFTEQDLSFGAAVAALLGVVVVDRRLIAQTTTTVDELRAQAEVVEQISDALITCDEHLSVLSWNTAAERIYGYAPSEAIGCDLSALLTSRYFTTEGASMTFQEVLASVYATGRWDGELTERHANGTSLVLVTSISAADGTGHHGNLVLLNRDVTAQRREEHLAMHDPLTGLPNRRMLTNRLREVFARACRTGRSMAVLFIDLDGFKPINDRFGHAAGDAVLTETAQRLVEVVRGTDIVGRLGGDEFLVILENAGSDENIRIVADRIFERVSEPMTIGGGDVSVRPSIGVAPARRPNADTHRPDQLLTAADDAMYLAKQRGGPPVFAEFRPDDDAP